MPVIRSSVEVPAEYEAVRPLYERADGLATLTPSWLDLDFEAIEGPLAPLEVGSRFRVTARLAGRGPALDGVVEIAEMTLEDDGGFVEDTLVDGPFDHWRHRRTLTPVSSGTRIEDVLRYRGPPGGSVGHIGAPLVMGLMFIYRRRRLQRVFNDVSVRAD